MNDERMVISLSALNNKHSFDTPADRDCFGRKILRTSYSLHHISQFPSLASHHAAHPRLPVSDEDGHQHHEATHRVVHEHRLKADSVQLLVTHCLRFTSPTHLKKTSKNLTVAQNLLSSDLRLRKPPNLLQSPR